MVMEDKPTRTILVMGEKEFRITIPEDSELTFGPWSPPKEGERNYNTREERRGTLRVYGPKRKEIYAVFSGVASFRDISVIEYTEKKMVLEGDTVWKSDSDGYEMRKSETRTRAEWVQEVPELVESPDPRGPQGVDKAGSL